MTMKTYVISTVATLIAVVAALPADPASAAEKTKVVATFSILGDLVTQVGGDRVDVSTLVDADGDAHVYSPTPADAKTVKAAKIVFVNGLGFEGWIDRLIKASGTGATIVTASKGVTPIEGEEEEGEHDKASDKKEDAGHDHGQFDPHAWQSVGNAKLYVGNIRDALIAVDADGKATYEANATAYLAKLDEVEKEVKDAIAKIPADRRRVITSHDAFTYFARDYGMEFIAPQGVSTETEASAKDVAKIITQIKAEKIPAVFIETITDTRLVERIAKETGAKIGGKVYSDALSDAKGPAATYVDMMRHNIKQFAAALTS
ncbi:MAG: metal ABC transporter substrate-binding protein [Hyphomicrobium sp.]